MHQYSSRLRDTNISIWEHNYLDVSLVAPTELCTGENVTDTRIDHMVLSFNKLLVVSMQK